MPRRLSCGAAWRTWSYPSVLILRMDPVARGVCMASGSDQITEPGGVVEITQSMLLTPAPRMLLAPMRDDYCDHGCRCPTFTLPPTLLTVSTEMCSVSPIRGGPLHPWARIQPASTPFEGRQSQAA